MSAQCGLLHHHVVLHSTGEMHAKSPSQNTHEVDSKEDPGDHHPCHSPPVQLVLVPLGVVGAESDPVPPTQ